MQLIVDITTLLCSETLDTDTVIKNNVRQGSHIAQVFAQLGVQIPLNAVKNSIEARHTSQLFWQNNGKIGRENNIVKEP